MPTANPRITITLTPELHAVMRRMSELTGNSQSSMVAELLATSQPVFERMVLVLEAARAAQGAVSNDVKQSLQVAQERLEAQLGLSLDALDDSQATLLHAAESIKRRRAGAGGRRPLTPASNRGVTPSLKGSKRSRDADAQRGMEWWNDLDEDERAHWLKVAGTAVVADAWEAFKSGGVRDGSF